MRIKARQARSLTEFAYRLLQLWARTLRFTIDDRAQLIGQRPDQRYIGALWHNRLLLFPFVLRRYLPERRGAALISTSRDGEILAGLVERFGFEVVRGSSSRKGASAIRQLAEVIARGQDVVITPDGPRGPAYELGQGIVYLAQQSGAEVVPVNLEFSSCWRVKSWDRFILPKPFSKVQVIFGPPHRVASTATDEEFERERLRLQEAILALVKTR